MKRSHKQGIFTNRSSQRRISRTTDQASCLLNQLMYISRKRSCIDRRNALSKISFIREYTTDVEYVEYFDKLVDIVDLKERMILRHHAQSLKVQQLIVGIPSKLMALTL